MPISEDLYDLQNHIIVISQLKVKNVDATSLIITIIIIITIIQVLRLKLQNYSLRHFRTFYKI